MSLHIPYLKYHKVQTKERSKIMLTKEFIDEILRENEVISASIKKIAKHYSISDFVKATKNVLDYFVNDTELKDGILSGCIYNQRNGYLEMANDSTEIRLVEEYIEFLYELFETKEDTDKVFYIVAYHYLLLGKQVGFNLTIKDCAMFPFWHDEITPLAKSRCNKMKSIVNCELYNIFPKLSEEDLKYYNHFHMITDCYHHATKQFSLIDRYDNFDFIGSRYFFDSKFKDALDLFVFRYKAIYANVMFHDYMQLSVIQQIVDSLADFDSQQYRK